MAFAIPTPTIDPIKVWDDEAGRPNHHVNRFQTIADKSSAKTIAKPECEPTCRINSTGNKDRMPKATAPLEVKTPK
jgi:hypothetical protein